MKRIVALGLALLALLCAGLGEARASQSATLREDADAVLEALLAEHAARFAGRAGDALPEPEPPQAAAPAQTWMSAAPDGALTVGMFEPLTGRFSLNLWGGSAADADVRALLHAYSPVIVDGPAYTLDSQVVYGFSSADYADGNQVFVVSIQDDLRYSDGTPVRARDYVFSMLLRASPLIAALGGEPEGCDAVVGMEAYRAGETDTLAGVRLLDAYSFSVEIDAAFADSVYALSSLDITPCPVELLAPGCDVVDEGRGTRVAEASGLSTPMYSVQMLERALLDADGGYLSSPRASTGPYRLERYDAGTGVACLVRNPYYKASGGGVQPFIEEIWIGPAPANAVDAISRGEIDLLRGLDEDDATGAAIQLAADSQAMLYPYARQGLGYLLLNCERSLLAFEAVRGALALCLDVDRLCGERSPYMAPPSGQTGKGNWACGMLDAPDSGMEAQVLEAYGALALGAPDIEEAVRKLEVDGWTLNEEGEAFVRGLHAVRYLRTGAGLMPLALRLAVPDDDRGEAIGEALPRMAAQIGALVEVQTLAADTLRSPVDVRGVIAEYDAVYVEEDVPMSASVLLRTLDLTGLDDRPLRLMIEAVRGASADDAVDFCGKWVQAQTRWMQVLPTIPLLSGLRFDLCASTLRGYEVAAEADWARAVAGAALVP